jgi:hypothetical protein
MSLYCQTVCVMFLSLNLYLYRVFYCTNISANLKKIRSTTDTLFYKRLLEFEKKLDIENNFTGK